jgi:ATP-dependent helicase HrpA
MAVEAALPVLHEQQKRLRQLPKNAQYAVEDINDQINYLFAEDTLSAARATDTQQYARYLKAIDLRIDKLLADVTKDYSHTQQIRAFSERVLHAGQHLALLPLSIRQSLFEFQWLLEELRVSLFAQQLKTPMPISTKRLDKRWNQIEDEIKRFLPHDL